MALKRGLANQIRFLQSKVELGDELNALEHARCREARRLTGVVNSIDICTMADVPASSGPGSCSAFTVALLRALHAYLHEEVPREQVAQQACRIEIDTLQRLLASNMTSDAIAEHHEAARKAGTIGGKIMGAGGGGFFLLYVRQQDQRRVRDAVPCRAEQVGAIGGGGRRRALSRHRSRARGTESHRGRSRCARASAAQSAPARLPDRECGAAAAG